jgi:hypothetical protein
MMQAAIFSKRAAHFCSTRRKISQKYRLLSLNSMNEEFMGNFVAAQL